jgi:Leucine-rich repeat (LRR) protein
MNMKEIQDPNNFYHLFIDNKISLQTFVEYLLTIIDKSEVLEHRIKSLEFLNDLKVLNKNVHRLIENNLVSDESFIIRALSFKYLLSNESDSALNILQWALQNDPSSLFLREVKKYLHSDEYGIILNTFNQRIEKISQNLQLNSIDILFLIDLGIELNTVNLVLTNFEIYYIQAENLLILIKDERIRELNLVLKLEYIPESIENLTGLEVLNLSYNRLTSLPDTFRNLKKLKLLDLSWNEFVEIPEMIKKLPSLKVINLDHNYIEEIPEEVHILMEKVDISLVNNPLSKK